MQLTQHDIDILAKLARIDLTAEQKETFSQHLTSILEYAERIQKVDTSGVAEAAERPAQTPEFRQDVAVPFQATGSLIDQFPDKHGHLNKVKRVFDHK